MQHVQMVRRGRDLPLKWSVEKPKEEQEHKEESHDDPKGEQKKLSRLEKDELFFHHLGDHWKTFMHKELDLHGFHECNS